MILKNANNLHLMEWYEFELYFGVTFGFSGNFDIFIEIFYVKKTISFNYSSWNFNSKYFWLILNVISLYKRNIIKTTDFIS